MGVEPSRRFNVSDGERVQLDEAAVARLVDWEEDWPYHANANQTYDRQHAQKAEKEVAIKRTVVEDVIILNREKR